MLIKFSCILDCENVAHNFKLHTQSSKMLLTSTPRKFSKQNAMPPRKTLEMVEIFRKLIQKNWSSINIISLLIFNCIFNLLTVFTQRHSKSTFQNSAPYMGCDIEGMLQPSQIAVLGQDGNSWRKLVVAC